MFFGYLLIKFLSKLLGMTPTNGLISYISKNISILFQFSVSINSDALSRRNKYIPYTASFHFLSLLFKNISFLIFKPIKLTTLDIPIIIPPNSWVIVIIGALEPP